MERQKDGDIKEYNSNPTDLPVSWEGSGMEPGSAHPGEKMQMVVFLSLSWSEKKNDTVLPSLNALCNLWERRRMLF